VCIERDLEDLCVLEVQVCTVGGAFGASEEFEELWRSFGGALRFWRPFGVWRCTSAGLVLSGGMWKHWMCMCAHPNIVSFDLSH